jgi:hypothetical protein
MATGKRLPQVPAVARGRGAGKRRQFVSVQL